MSVECERVKGINLAQGICDTEVPPPVRQGAHEAIENGQNQYTRLDGIAGLRAGDREEDETLQRNRVRSRGRSGCDWRVDGGVSVDVFVAVRDG